MFQFNEALKTRSDYQSIRIHSYAINPTNYTFNKSIIINVKLIRHSVSRHKILQILFKLLENQIYQW